MTESRVYVGMALVLAGLTIACVLNGQWIGAIGSALGVTQALSARYFLLKAKPSAATE